VFQGTIPQDMRNILNQVVETWSPRNASQPVGDIFVARSGNFAVERVLSERGHTMHGCDVNLYTCTLGSFLARQEFRLELKPQYRALIPWMAEGMKDATSRTATLLLADQFAHAFTAEGPLKPSPYYTRLVEGYRQQWGDLLHESTEKLDNLALRLDSFEVGDAGPWLAILPRECPVVSYPLFWGNGYETMFRGIERLFDWDKPVYKDIDGEAMETFLADLVNRDHWAFGLPIIHEDYKSYLRGLALTTNRGVPIYIYASHGPTRVVMPRQDTAPVPVPRLTPGRIVQGESISLVQLTGPQFNSLRSQYMNATLKPAGASLAFGVLVDGYLAGCFAFFGDTGSRASDPNTVYLLSDFAVAPTDYKRLSKLILHAALSRESQMLAERMTRRRVRWLFTTAFTDNPVSMKYRGLFKLYSRKELDGDPEHKFALNYQADAGQWTLQEGLDLWLKKHAQN